MKANKKQLAMLVGMALSVTVGVGMNPMDAYAATSVSWDNTYTDETIQTAGSYKVTSGEGGATVKYYTNATNAMNAIAAALAADTQDSAIDLTETTWKAAGDTGATKLGELISAWGTTTEVTIANGKSVQITDANGTYKVTGGTATTVTKTGDGTFAVGGAGASVVVNSTKAVDITVNDTSGATVQIAEGSTGAVTLNSGGSGTVTSLDVDENVTVKGTKATTTINVATGKTLTLDASSTVATGEISGGGNVTVSGDSAVSTGAITAGTLTVNGNGSLTSSGDISATSISAEGAAIGAGSNAISVGTAGTITAKTVTAKTVTAKTVTAKTVTLTNSSGTTINDSSPTYTVETLATDGGDLTIDAAAVTTGIKNLQSSGALSIDGDVSTVESFTATDELTVAADTVISPNAAIEATTFDYDGTDALTVKSLKAGDVQTNGQNITVTDEITINGAVTKSASASNADAGVINAGKVTLGTEADFSGNDTVTIQTDTLNVNGESSSISSKLTNLTLQNSKGEAFDGTINITEVTGDNFSTIKSALDTKLGTEQAKNVNYTATMSGSESALATDQNNITTANDLLNSKVNAFAGVDAAEVANYDPFEKQLPSLSDVHAISAADPTKITDLSGSISTFEGAAVVTEIKNKIAALKETNEEAYAAYAENLAELEAMEKKVAAEKKLLTAEGMQAQAAKLTAATQQAGKTAAPGISSARAAAIINDVMTGNVVDRTSELRETAAAVEDGRPAPDNVWFQYKHTNTEVGSGDVYNESTVKTNNYQLGYDKKIGENDYLGAYIGTTTGSVEFNGPARSGDADIDSSYQVGIYGTHMLPKDQYIDYMIHTGKFDTKYNGETWGTKDTGAMVGYGAKIAANERLTWNPYIRLAYDKVSVDSYKAGVNDVSSDDSNNWTAKIGINLMDASGFYGGLAYSRGLSGSYNAYINGIAMPTEDFNANVIYLSLGYRANLSKKVFLDLSAEKTFADYKGWTAAGKVNFYF